MEDFGGCTINIVQEDAIGDLYGRIRTAYGEAYGIDLKMYVTSPEDGNLCCENDRTQIFYFRVFRASSASSGDSQK